ncbi:1-phosphatidylinositol 4 [Escovopsis weberi]|uniref:Phosphoinositide phospholipase C n=1 Tax=Escovopsis weberi TaxID=150374 RepID=A0A0M8MUK7_ESCWE|nr:1-phosphatidylinositol 4 [Escovopsis weberi]
MSPSTAVLTTNSSIQPSPEPMRPRDDDPCPSGFQLPESIVSRKTSLSSLAHSWAGSPATNAEPLFNSNFTSSAGASSINGGNVSISNHSNPCSSSGGSNGLNSTDNTSGGASNNGNNNSNSSSNKGNIIRRLSSQASRRISTRRRQSSAAPTSRETSVGPCFLRRPSDSSTAVASEFGIANTDSESDIDERDDICFRPVFYLDGNVRDSSANSTTGSISGSSTAMAGPVIPIQLQQGTWLRKVSKKKRSKRVCLVYDPSSNKIMWDKNRPQKFLHVDEVREIRTGSDIQQYGRDFNIPESERSTWFSILYVVPEKSKSKFLHLLAEDAETYQMWVDFLESMLKHRQEVMASLMTFDERAIAQYWQSEMCKQFGEHYRTQGQEELDINGVMRICQNLHIYSSQSTLQANFHLSDFRRRERLNFAEFIEFVRLMRQRQEVHRLMPTISACPESGLTLDEFLAFLKNIQGEEIEAKRSAWEKLFVKFIRKYQQDDDLGPNELGFMSEAAFIGYLSSRHNPPIIEDSADFTLDRPMNEYFISSSHNTYLLGRQVAGQSSIEGYISALVRGCRCVEVDCWDGPDGQPLVVHGRTLTSSISFKEVMTTINKYAFVKSGFPLWISLEVHCNAAQQAIMAETIKEAFGARLVTEPLDPTATKLPSPSELMERILIKVKQPRSKEDPNGADPLSCRKRGNSLSSPLARPTVSELTMLQQSQSLPQSPLLPPSNTTARRMTGKSRVKTIHEGEGHEMIFSCASDTDSGSEGGQRRGSSNNIIPVLGKLGVYCAGQKFNGFDSPRAKRFNHIFSFMESSFAKNSRTKDEKMALDIHNMRYLMRVYPDGTRLASSNFDPLLYWRRGVQMAALNWQTFDLGMQLNQAMFAGGTDSSGYVLKPTELRDIQVLPFNSDIAEGKKERSVVSFSIDVLSAQQLMRPANLAASKSMDFYVEVEVYHTNDKRNKKEKDFDLTHEQDSPLKFQTEVIRENGFNPTFANGQFRFKVTTKHPELVFVRWSVRLSSDGESYNSKDRQPMASFSAKLTNLKQGYRTLPLLNHLGEQYLFSSLFCKINMDPIEKILIGVSPRPTHEGGSKLNRFSGKVFGRSNTSPRSTMEKESLL